jgi:hypothetical protein
VSKNRFGAAERHQKGKKYRELFPVNKEGSKQIRQEKYHAVGSAVSKGERRIQSSPRLRNNLGKRGGRQDRNMIRNSEGWRANFPEQDLTKESLTLFNGLYISILIYLRTKP